MLDGDIFRRFILYPLVFPNDVFDRAWLFRFVDLEKDKVFGMSFTSKYLLPDDDKVHGFGRLTAEEQNKAYVERKGHAPNPSKSYLGFYELYKWSLTSPKLVSMNISLRRRTEMGNEAHFDLLLIPKAGATKKSEFRDDKKDLQDFMSRGIMGPALCPEATKLVDEALLSTLPNVPKFELSELMNFTIDSSERVV